MDSKSFAINKEHSRVGVSNASCEHSIFELPSANSYSYFIQIHDTER